MNKRILIIPAAMAILAIALTIAWFVLGGKNNSDENIDGYIKATKIGDKVLLVGLGYDAVIAIASQKGIVVVDAGMSNSLTAKYCKIIETTFGRNDFLYLINTHSHQDHTGGNQIFSEATIIGHQNCPAEMAEYWKNREEIKGSLATTLKNRTNTLKKLKSGTDDWTEAFCRKAYSQYSYYDLEHDRIVTPPKLTFSDSLTLPIGDMTLNLFYFGPAHSRSDILVHIPELKLLLTGDLFSKGGYASLEKELLKVEPGLRERSAKWLLSRWNDIETVIGGHGQMMTQTDLKLFLERLKEIPTKQ
jgi:glyoxylase-like metal-dependent hydrolase (beta-lactamase superfamily II)